MGKVLHKNKIGSRFLTLLVVFCLTFASVLTSLSLAAHADEHGDDGHDHIPVVLAASCSVSGCPGGDYGSGYNHCNMYGHGSGACKNSKSSPSGACNTHRCTNKLADGSRCTWQVGHTSNGCKNSSGGGGGGTTPAKCNAGCGNTRATGSNYCSTHKCGASSGCTAYGQYTTNLGPRCANHVCSVCHAIAMTGSGPCSSCRNPGTTPTTYTCDEPGCNRTVANPGDYCSQHQQSGGGGGSTTYRCSYPGCNSQVGSAGAMCQYHMSLPTQPTTCSIHPGYPLPCARCSDSCAPHGYFPAASCPQCNPPQVSVRFVTDRSSFPSGGMTRVDSFPQGQLISAFLNNAERPISPASDGSSFSYWDTAGSSVVTGGMTITAVWTPPPPQPVTITWVQGSGATIVGGATQQAMTGQQIILPDLHHPAYLHFTWTATATGLNPNPTTGLTAGNQYLLLMGGPTQYTFTAVWDTTTTRPYTVTLTPGDWTSAPAGWMNPPQGVTQSGNNYQMTVNALTPNTLLPGSSTANRPDFVLTGWEVVTTGVNTEVELGYSLRGMASQNITVRALWRALDYEVHFNAGVGSFPTGSLPAGWARRSDKLMVFAGSQGSTVSSPMQPTSPDFEFTGWRMDGTFVPVGTTFSIIMPSQGATVYAEWREINRTLRLYTNAPVGALMANGTTFSAFMSTRPEAEYFNQTFVRGADLTPWLQSIESHPNFNDPSSDPSVIRIRFRGPFSDITFPGYEFRGWSTNASTLVEYTQLSSMPGNTPMVELYAIWAPRPFRITFNLSWDWDTDSAFLSQQDPYVMNVMFGQAITPPNAMQITRVGYTLHSWHEMSVDFTSGIPAAGYVWPATMPASDIEVKAAWTPKTITLKYQTNVVGMVISDSSVAVRGHTGVLSLPKPHPNNSDTDPSKNKYFAGWYSKDGSASNDWDEAYRLDPSGFFMPVVDGPNYYLYARWTETPAPPDPIEYYTLLFDAQGGLVNGQARYTLPQQLEEGDQVTASQVPANPVQEGYKFEGWFTAPCDPSCNQRDHSGCSGVQVTWPYTVSGTNYYLTVYARWTAVPYTLTFVNSLTGNVVHTQQVYVNESLSFFDRDIPSMGDNYVTGEWWTANGWFDNSLHENNDLVWGMRVDFSTALMWPQDTILYARYYALRLEIQYVNALPNSVEETVPVAKDVISNGDSYTTRTQTISAIGLKQIGWAFLSHDAVRGIGSGYSFDPSASNYFCDYHGGTYCFGMGESTAFMDATTGEGLFMLGLDQYVIRTYGLTRYHQLLTSSDQDALRKAYRIEFLQNGLGVLKLYPIWEQVDMFTVQLGIPQTHIVEETGRRYSGKNLVREWTEIKPTTPQEAAAWVLELQSYNYMNCIGTGLENSWVDVDNSKMIDKWKGVTGTALPGGSAIPAGVTRFTDWQLLAPSGSSLPDIKIFESGITLTYAAIQPYISSTGIVQIRALWGYQLDINRLPSCRRFDILGYGKN